MDTSSREKELWMGALVLLESEDGVVEAFGQCARRGELLVELISRHAQPRTRDPCKHKCRQRVVRAAASKRGGLERERAGASVRNARETDEKTGSVDCMAAPTHNHTRIWSDREPISWCNTSACGVQDKEQRIVGDASLPMLVAENSFNALATSSTGLKSLETVSPKGSLEPEAAIQQCSVRTKTQGLRLRVQGCVD